MKVTLYAFSLSLILASSAAFAVSAPVDFPVGQENGTFSCTYEGKGQVHISTENVKVKGFCAGDPGVSTPGQLTTFSDSIKNYYFSIEKSAAQSGTVTIESTDTGNISAITCAADQGGKQEYPYGSDYC